MCATLCEVGSTLHQTHNTRHSLHSFFSLNHFSRLSSISQPPTPFPPPRIWVSSLRNHFYFPPPPTSDELQFFSVTSGFTRLIMKTKYVCHDLISLYVNFHNNRTMWSTNLLVKICRWGGGKEKEPKYLYIFVCLPWLKPQRLSVLFK